MKTLGSVWEESGKNAGLRVRFCDWNWRHKYFTIESVSQCGTRLQGQLDCGEKISFPLKSINWEVYYNGAEFTARAV